MLKRRIVPHPTPLSLSLSISIIYMQFCIYNFDLGNSFSAVEFCNNWYLIKSILIRIIIKGDS